MDPALIGLLEPVVVFGTLLGLAFGVKFLVWGRGSIRDIRRRGDSSALEQRVLELEERLDQSSHLAEDQAARIDELDERLDFAERLMTRGRVDKPSALPKPEIPTPV